LAGKYIILENFNLKQRYRVWYKISIQPNAHSHIDPKIMAVDSHYFR
jgi:hypothetical protein